jgi:5-methyltetrahydrofolate--homocysteine methyltransferase
MTVSFREALAERVLVLDGAMGTQIHAADLEVERDYLGHENCVEVVNRTRPEVIQAIHEGYLEVGCDAVETNTFGCNPLVLGEFGIASEARELNRLAAEIARRACEKHARKGPPRYVLGSMGPGRSS